MMSTILLLTVLSAPKPISVTLAWDPSPSPEVIGYRIYYGNSTRTYANIVDVGNVLTAKVESLKSRTEYFFAATAYADNGLESDFSNEAVYTTPTFRPTMKLENTVLSFQSPPGDQWLIEETWDFINWRGLQTAAPLDGVVTVPLEFKEPMRFFRAQLLPRDNAVALTMAKDAVMKTLPAIPKPKRLFKSVDMRKGAQRLIERPRVKPILKSPPMPSVKAPEDKWQLFP